MADVSGFRGVIDFFNQIGIYDVVLPFLLVFTIIFAILEKTAIFGYADKENKVTKKNLNSMTAFVIAFLVVASSRLVAIINTTMSQIVLLALISISFLMLVGVFVSSGEKLPYYDQWTILFSVIIFIAIALIFLNALGWLDPIFTYIYNYWNGTVVGSIILMLVVIGFMFYITKEPKKKEEKKS